MPFQYGMRALGGDPINSWDVWISLFDTREGRLPAQIVATGRSILSYERQQHAEAIRADGFPATIDGLHVLCMNRRSCGSQVFEALWDPQLYDAMLAFGYDGKKWSVSLYTDKPGVNVGEVARKWGGGGHERAAGFQIVKLPQELGG